MFTGIIETVGTLTGLTPKGADVSITVDSGDLDLSDVKLGDSIATNGVCLTVVELLGNGYRADVSLETIKRSGFAHYRIGDKVNLEKALTLSTRLGGHLVSGHVDGVAVAIIDDTSALVFAALATELPAPGIRASVGEGEVSSV